MSPLVLAVLLFVTVTPQAPAAIDDQLADARRLYDERQIERAETLFREALQRAEQAKLPAAQAYALLGIGRIEGDLDHRTQSRQTLERALTLFEQIDDRGGHAQALIASGVTLSVLGDRTEGVRRIMLARDRLRALGDRENVARAAAALMTVMLPGPAKDRERDAALADAREGTSRAHECGVTYMWASDTFRAGDYATANTLYQRALACYQPLPHQPRLASVYLGLGDIERMHGQFEAALASYQRGLAISKETNNAIGTITAMVAVGTGQWALLRLDEARATLESALALARERQAETFTPYVIGTLGGLLVQMKAYRDAIPLLKESLERTTDARFQIERLMQLGNAYGHIGDVKAALDYCDRAVTLARATDPPQLMNAYRWRAEVRRLANDVDGAAADLRDGITVVEDLRRKTVPVDFMKRGFSEWHQWLFGSSIALSMQKGQVRDAIETAERARARAFLDLLATRETTTPGPDPTVAPTAPAATVAAPDADAAANGATSPLEPRGQRAANPNSSVPTAATAAGRSASVAGASSAAAAGMSDAAREDVPRIESSQAVPAATLPEMVAAAKRMRSTLLVYWVALDATYIWVIAPNGAVHHAVTELSLPEATSLAAATRTPPGLDVAGVFALTRQAQRKPWRDLYDRLIAPVHAHLPTSPDALVTIVPHGPLFQLSFAALQDERGRYLLERYRLHYTPAVGVLTYTSRRQEMRRAQATSTPTGRASEATTAASPAAARRANDVTTLRAADAASRAIGPLLVGDPGDLPSQPGTGPLPALPYASREVTEIASMLSARGLEASVLVGAQASEAAVRAQVPQRPLIHFATHAIVHQAEELSSFLALRADAVATSGGTPPAASTSAVATDSSPIDAARSADASSAAASDGRLTAHEVYSLKLDADLVVLSACSSALGPMTGDGVIGFTRAFLYAGASSVIATAWDVPDAAGYEVMRRFYRSRRSMPIASRALRAAQLETLAALRRGALKVPASASASSSVPAADARGAADAVALPEHPLFWAGFLLVGEP